jgi:hypothetical protein
MSKVAKHDGRTNGEKQIGGQGVFFLFKIDLSVNVCQNQAHLFQQKGVNWNCSGKIKDKLSQYQKNSVRASIKSGNMGITEPDHAINGCSLL